MRPSISTILSGALLLVALVLLALGIGHLASANRAVKLQATAAVVATGRARGARAVAPVPTFDLDALDLVLVHEAVTTQINQARDERGLPPLAWDEALQELAEGRAVRLSSRRSLGHRQGRGDLGRRHRLSARWVDNALAEQLGEPAAELRACLSANVTTPEDVARHAVGGWLDEPKFAMMLLGSWGRIGVGFDWPCPQEDAGGLVLVVVLAGGRALREG